MAVDTDYALAISQGIASVAPITATNPLATVATALNALTTPWIDLGALSTSGISENLSETRTEFKRWGNIATFKTVITDEKHTFDVTFLESNANVLGLFYRTPTPVPDVTTKGMIVTDDTTGKLDVRSFVFDLVQDASHIRFYIPRGEVTARKNPTYNNSGLIEYGVTITAYPTPAGVAVQRAFLLDALVNP